MEEQEEKGKFIDLIFEKLPEDTMISRAEEYYTKMENRRTTRHFSDKQIPRQLIELAIKTASTAPSGAHLQPWTFVAISNQEIKAKIRQAAEIEEKKTYSDRMPEAWSEVLEPLGTDYVKEHLTIAPWLIVVFRHSKRIRKNGQWAPTYYSQESCGIATGLLISAIHNMGLTTLTHTPSPMTFLREILDRPKHEHAILIMPVGYPHENAQIPNLRRKSLREISKFIE